MIQAFETQKANLEVRRQNDGQASLWLYFTTVVNPFDSFDRTMYVSSSH